MKKKITLLMACVSLGVSLLLSGCAARVGCEDEALAKEYYEKTDAVFQEVFELSDQKEINSKVEESTELGDTSLVSLYQAWGNEKKSLGDYVGEKDYEVFESEDSGKYVKCYACEITYEFEERDAVAKILYDKDGNMTSISFEGVYTIGEKMVKAGLNTILGMGSVFVVLIIIILIISLSGNLVPKLEKSLEIRSAKRAEKKKRKEIEKAKKKGTYVEPEPVPAPAPAPTPVAAVETETEDDGELIAVISAAIAAYEAETGNDGSGLVVRSIRRVENSKWRRA